MTCFGITNITLVAVKITVLWRPLPKVNVYELEMPMVDITYNIDLVAHVFHGKLLHELHLL